MDGGAGVLSADSACLEFWNQSTQMDATLNFEVERLTDLVLLFDAKWHPADCEQIGFGHRLRWV